MPISMVIAIIEEAHRLFGKHVTFDQYRKIAFRLYPEEMKALEGNFSRQGWIRWFKAGARKVINLTEDESEEDSPKIQLDLLPGMPVPMYVNVGTDRDMDLRRFDQCTADDVRTAIGIRQRVTKRIADRIEDLEQKLAWIEDHAQHSAETVGEIINRLSRRGGKAV